MLFRSQPTAHENEKSRKMEMGSAGNTFCNKKKNIQKAVYLLSVGIMIVVCLFRLTMPVKVWNFPAKELVLNGQGIYFESGVVEGNAPGWYVDNSMEHGDVFIQTPEIDLPVGSYEIILEYQTDADGAVYSFKSDSSTYRVLLGRWNARLNPGKRRMVLENKYFMPEAGFHIDISYEGDGYLIVNSIAVRQTRAWERVAIFMGILLLGGYVCCCKFRAKINTGKLLRALGVSVAAQIPFLSMYLYKGDDLWFHLLRIEGLARGLASGQFPVRIQPVWMNGYGYPVSIFYGDGILAVAGLLRLIGFSLQASYKIYVFLISFLTYLVMEYSIKQLLGDDRIAVVGGVLYTLSPYRLLNIYDRAAVGEYTAMVFLPLIFVGLQKIMEPSRERDRKGWLILAVGMAGVIQSHVLTCEMVALVIFFTCLFFWKRFRKKDPILELGKAAILTCLLSLWFLVPFLDYYLNEAFRVNNGDYGGYIQTMGASLSQLLDIFPRHSGQIVSIVEGLEGSTESSQAVGGGFLIGLFMFLYGYYRKKDLFDRNEQETKTGLYCCIVATILIGMSTVWFPWDFLYHCLEKLNIFLAMLQFPWRLLGIASLMLTAVACIAVKKWKQSGKYVTVLYIGLIGAIGLSAGSYFSSLLESKEVYYVSDVETFGTFELVGGEYMPAGVRPNADEMQEDRLWHGQEIVIIYHDKNGTIYRMEAENLSTETQYVELPMLYYRGYQAKDLETGEKLILESGENGRIRVYLDGGYRGTVQVKFQEPAAWRIAEVISGLSVLGLAVWFVQQRWGRKSKREAVC